MILMDIFYIELKKKWIKSEFYRSYCINFCLNGLIFFLFTDICFYFYRWHKEERGYIIGCEGGSGILMVTLMILTWDTIYQSAGGKTLNKIFWHRWQEAWPSITEFTYCWFILPEFRQSWTWTSQSVHCAPNQLT